MELKIKNQAKKVKFSKATQNNPIEKLDADQCEVLDALHREMKLDDFQMWADEYHAYQLRAGELFEEPPKRTNLVGHLMNNYSVLQEKYPEIVEELTDWLIFDQVRDQFAGGAFWKSLQPAPEQVMKQFFVKYPQLTKEVSGTWALNTEYAR